jgi:hypothetical protein
MKQYLLKLIEVDIENTMKYLISWEKMLDKFKTDPYQIKRKLAMERKLEKISRYKTRLQNEL